MTGLASMKAEDVAKWLGRVFIETRGVTSSSKQATLTQAEAVLALVEAKVRAALEPADETTRRRNEAISLDVEDAIVRRVMEAQ